MKKFILLSFLLLISSFSSFSWNARGHMVVASIASSQLAPEQKDEIVALLKYHPEYSSWHKKYEKTDRSIEICEFLMMHASVWPDKIRDKSNPNSKFHRPEWHYITYKMDFINGHDTSKVGDKNDADVVWAIGHTQKMIQNGSYNYSTRAMYLAWLIHLIGDIHQPLHCASLFNETYKKGDRGGNLFFVKPHSRAQNLHHIWDYGLGSTGKKNTEMNVKKQADRIVKKLSESVNGYDLKSFDARKWSIESFNHAVIDAHLNGKLKGVTEENKENAPTLPEGYLDDRKKLSDLRGLLGGLRLGNTLNSLKIKANHYNHDGD